MEEALKDERQLFAALNNNIDYGKDIKGILTVAQRPGSDGRTRLPSAAGAHSNLTLVFVSGFEFGQTEAGGV